MPQAWPESGWLVFVNIYNLTQITHAHTMKHVKKLTYKGDQKVCQFPSLYGPLANQVDDLTYGDPIQGFKWRGGGRARLGFPTPHSKNIYNHK